MSNSKTNSKDIAKKAAGEAAAALVEGGMLVGLGTGSTAAFFIQSLIRRVQNGLNITAVATSIRSEEQAREGGIPFADLNTLSSLDICFDGADEIDTKKRMIKGGGGALLREKIIANMSNEMVVLVDESKCVERLGAFPLAVEVCRFAPLATVTKILNLGFSGKIREDKSGKQYITDNGNYIYDLRLPEERSPLEEVHRSLIEIPGVVETGLFLHEAGRVIVGKDTGEVVML